MPTKEETETIISWTSADEYATVYTLHPRIKRLCERAGGQEIRRDEGIRKGVKEAWTFLVDISSIAVRKKRQGRTLTPEQRLAAAQRFAEQKKQKPPLPA